MERQELNEFCRKIDNELWLRHNPGAEPIPEDSSRQQWRLCLEKDVRFLAKKVPLRELKDEVAALAVKHGIDEAELRIPWDAIRRCAEIKGNWQKAFETIEQVEEISQIVGYGFDSNDLKELARLHEAGQFRDKIEYLLLDCNCHTLLRLLGEHDYEGARRWIREEIE